MTVEAVRRGEPQVLAELLAQYGREIQGVAYLILRNRADAEDVLMDTLPPRLIATRVFATRTRCVSGSSRSSQPGTEPPAATRTREMAPALTRYTGSSYGHDRARRPGPRTCHAARPITGGSGPALLRRPTRGRDGGGDGHHPIIPARLAGHNEQRWNFARRARHILITNQ